MTLVPVCRFIWKTHHDPDHIMGVVPVLRPVQTEHHDRIHIKRLVPARRLMRTRHHDFVRIMRLVVPFCRLMRTNVMIVLMSWDLFLVHCLRQT